MESSSLVSWQFENFSTAELSPPSSPVSPSSPLFYHDGGDPSSPSGSLKVASGGSLSKAVLSNRAQTASNMLNELERLHSFEQQSAFAMNTSEESVDLNMNLFEELADIEYTPPVTIPQEEKAFEVPTIGVPSPGGVVPSSNEKLSQEYKSILESLTTTTTSGSSNSVTSIMPIAPVVASKSNVVTSLSDLIQITGIPTTTLVGDECLVPVEFIGRTSTTTNAEGEFGPEEAESMDLDGIIISSDMELINESELFSLEELSAELIAEEASHQQHVTTDSSMLVNGVLPAWTKQMAIPMDELDTQITKNDETLNALLQGDVRTAKSVISPPAFIQQAFSPISDVSEDIVNEELEEAEVIEVIEKKPAKAPKKTERRGRKPIKKDSLNYVRDKALRKKEQNKTAATRYRQKKKQELVVTLAEEEELQTIHDDLEKQREKVGSELRMIRGLLRDMLQARKKRSASVLTPASTKLTASSIVQAQRIANRRK